MDAANFLVAASVPFSCSLRASLHVGVRQPGPVEQLSQVDQLVRARVAL
jgi:hypothetical protein